MNQCVDPYPMLFFAVFLLVVIQGTFVFVGWWRRNAADHPVTGSGNVKSDEFIQTESKK